GEAPAEILRPAADRVDLRVELLRQALPPYVLARRGVRAEEIAHAAEGEDQAAVDGGRGARAGAPPVAFELEERSDGKGPDFLARRDVDGDQVLGVAAAADR